MIDIQETASRLETHLRELTVVIGERSVMEVRNLKRAEDYITAFHESMGLQVEKESYAYSGIQVANVIARLNLGPDSDEPPLHYLLGAHYDSVEGTVGADDNASAVAVQLEVARNLLAQSGEGLRRVSVKLVSFALEEPPVFGTPFQGSAVHSRNARSRGERIDGMICLEMVGYACREPGCQQYPFPVNWMGYPKTGDFIGIVGNFASRPLTRSLVRSFRRNGDLPVVSLSVPLNGWPLPAVRLSDHAAFWDQGYRSVMITDSAFFRNPHYHLPSDTMDKLDFRFMAELVESLVVFFSSQAAGKNTEG
jgi:Zn-dependent M28 family amino/carboxypeptidase